MNGTTLLETCGEKDLGVLVDPSLSFSQHIEQQCAKAVTVESGILSMRLSECLVAMGVINQ